ncbi:MAG: 3-deoxy-manno-octulosonate cytidylyltransferase [Myxococcales bacterium]|nr:3-deoxy-manno-octulosonate cytidylyltransferase [Myxococcales bacterium]
MRIPFKVVIPARFASTRLPGKPLAEIAGRPLIAHVIGAARRSSASQIVVATDDARVRAAALEAEAEVVMTREDHASGTDRLAEVAETLGWPDETIVLNLQGDEPQIPASLLERLAGALRARPEVGLATACTAIHESRDLFDPNVVKCVLAEDGLALTFSRAPIPWVRDAFGPALWEMGAPPAALPAGVPFLRHLGLYAYRVSTLRRLSAAPQASLERAESLEQLRALALGLSIHVTVLSQAPPHGVDTPEDLERVRAALEG